MPDLGPSPVKRYKWFRPRQASRGRTFTSTPTNFATIYLWNNSTAAQILVVRAFQTTASDSTDFYTNYVQGKTGSASGKITPLIPTEAQGPGLLYADDLAAVSAADYSSFANDTEANFIHDFPFAIIPPNWSLQFQASGQTIALGLSILWEAIYPDELDYLFDL